MSEVAEKAAEIVAENVEDTIDGVVETLEVVRSNPVAVTIAAVAGLVVGGVGGYLIAKKRLRSFYEEVATSEIAQAKVFYSQVNKVGEDGIALSPQDVMAQRHGTEAVEALRRYQGKDAVVETPVGSEYEAIARAKNEQGGPWDEEMDERQIRKIEEGRRLSSSDPKPDPSDVVQSARTRNVFEDPTFNLEEERLHRTDSTPYVITYDEYFEAEKDYEQIALTFFEVDGVLIDTHDSKPIADMNVVGDANLARFGDGSKDKNTVYVRNDRQGVDYEIVRSSGSYLEEVLGLPPEESNSLKHSDQRDRRRAFKHGDG